MTFTCPACGRTIYNRRRVTCEFCGETIPSALLLSPTQIAAIERLKAAEAKEHAEFMSRQAWNSANPSTGGILF
jgi:hypothetical protein